MVKKNSILYHQMSIYIYWYIVPILLFFVTKHQGSSMAIVFERQVQWQFVSHEWIT